MDIESFGTEIITLGTPKPFKVLNERSQIRTVESQGTNNLERLYSLVYQRGYSVAMETNGAREIRPCIFLCLECEKEIRNNGM